MKLETVMPHLKQIQKKKKESESRETPLDLCWHQLFKPEISNSRYVEQQR